MAERPCHALHLELVVPSTGQPLPLLTQAAPSHQNCATDTQRMIQFQEDEYWLTIQSWKLLWDKLPLNSLFAFLFS